MKKQGRSFIRKNKFRSKNVTYIIAVEGHVTEQSYFKMFKVQGAHIDVQIVSKRTKGHPMKVYSRLKEHIEINEILLKKGDEAWLVVDRDEENRTEQQLNEVYEKCRNENFGFSLSNPCFEYWLLLHFETPAAKSVSNVQNCKKRLIRHLPNYEKNNVEINKLRPRVRDAVDNAKRLDSPPCLNWPHSTGSTVYRIVEKLLPSEI